MGLRHGAKQTLDELNELDEAILDLLNLAVDRIKYNPDFARERIREAQDKVRKARRVRDERLPEMLQKAAPPIQAQVDELRERIEALEAERAGVIRLRKAE